MYLCYKKIIFNVVKKVFMYEVFYECVINCNMLKMYNLIYINIYFKVLFFKL